MQIEAIYRQGRLEFITPVKLKSDNIRVLVEVPDEAVEPQDSAYGLPPEVIAGARAKRERLDAIRNAPLPPDDELPELSDKQQQRLDAFVLREDR